jgi:hypothetical protein
MLRQKRDNVFIKWGKNIMDQISRIISMLQNADEPTRNRVETVLAQPTLINSMQKVLTDRSPGENFITYLKTLLNDTPTTLTDKLEMFATMQTSSLLTEETIQSCWCKSLDELLPALATNQTFRDVFPKLMSFAERAKTGKGEGAICMLTANSQRLSTRAAAGDILVSSMPGEIKNGGASLDSRMGVGKVHCDERARDVLFAELHRLLPSMKDHPELAVGKNLTVGGKDRSRKHGDSKKQSCINQPILWPTHSKRTLGHTNPHACIVALQQIDKQDAVRLLTQLLNTYYPTYQRNAEFAERIYNDLGTDNVHYHFAEMVFDMYQQADGFKFLIVTDNGVFVNLTKPSDIWLMKEHLAVNVVLWRGGSLEQRPDGYVGISIRKLPKRSKTKQKATQNTLAQFV